MANTVRPRGVNTVATANADIENMQAGGVEMAVATMMPAIITALGDGTESDEECIVPFHTPHITWDCLLDSPGVSPPEKTMMLIDSDSGSCTVLIDSRLASRLALW